MRVDHSPELVISGPMVCTMGAPNYVSSNGSYMQTQVIKGICDKQMEQSSLAAQNLHEE